MRESIGSAVLIQIFMVFIVLYTSILAIAINYSITFRVKNQIINIIEDYDGCSNKGDNADLSYNSCNPSGASAIESYINSIGYYKRTPKNMRFENNASDLSCEYFDAGYKICAIEDPQGMYFEVTAYVTFDVPLLGEYFTYPVSGQTRVFYNSENIGKKMSG